MVRPPVRLAHSVIKVLPVLQAKQVSLGRQVERPKVRLDRLVLPRLVAQLVRQAQPVLELARTARPAIKD